MNDNKNEGKKYISNDEPDESVNLSNEEDKNEDIKKQNIPKADFQKTFKKIQKIFKEINNNIAEDIKRKTFSDISK